MIKNNIADIRKKIATAAKISHRPPDAITLIAVGKNHGIDKIQKAYAHGINNFGENKLQEAMAKFIDPSFREKIILHFIGHLQSNKVKKAVQFFDYIHSLDRESLATQLAKEKNNWQLQKPFPKLLIEVNFGEESQKSGVVSKHLPDFFYHCKNELDLPIVGLMAILPFDMPAAPFFASLKKQSEELNLLETSMGMTNDYQPAIELGASMVRIGTGIFGER
ncbi:MAG: YggS family pyridoxal phosphate-dependent enzyme [Alphaproteobacteria bacterium]